MKAVLAEIRPTAEYEGRVYDQDILIETEAGTLIRAEDTKKKVEDEMIGKPVSVVLKADNCQDVGRIEPETYELIPREETPGFVRIAGHVISVTAENDHRDVVEIACGEGRVNCHLDREAAGGERITKDDWIAVDDVLGLYVTDITLRQ